MEHLYKVFVCLSGFFLVILFVLFWAGPLIDMDSRIQNLENFHSNICSECGQVLHN